MKKLNMNEYDKIISECRTISIKKNNDYGCKSLTNFGGKGVIIRVSDKIERLVNLVWHQNKMSVNEKVEDTCMDIINYCVYLIMMSRRKLINK